MIRSGDHHENVYLALEPHLMVETIKDNADNTPRFDEIMCTFL